MSEKRYSRQNGEISQINRDMGSLKPDELLDGLADAWDSMDDKNFDPGVIDAYLAALEEAGQPEFTFDAEAALANFHEKHALLFEQTESAAQEKQSHSGRHHCLRMTRLIAVAVAVTLLCMVAAQAMGYDVFGVIARWTEETFSFSFSDQPNETQLVSEQSEGEYDSLQAALDAYGITETLAPTWYPEDFEMTGISVISSAFGLKFHATYEAEDKFLAVSIWLYESEEVASSRVFEKDDEPVTLYEKGGVTHYLMSNLGRHSAVWMIQNIMGSISGDLTEDEVKQMVDSIYQAD